VKTVLCYGDSLTFGMNAEISRRHAHEDQWPSVLEAGLGGGARIVNEGLGGRTTMFDDYSTPADRNGARVLPTVLSTHMPLDLVIVMLGTNDLKTFVNGSAYAAAQGIKRLIEIVRTFPWGTVGGVLPQMLVVAPPLVVPVRQEPKGPALAPRTDESRLFAEHYRRVAIETGSGFFDAATVARATAFDGVHLDAQNTRAIGSALVPIVTRMLNLKKADAA
jgi:lysophospholipase L1-like esterase